MATSATNSRTLWQRFALAMSLSLACAVTQAAPVSFSGSVADCSNPALVGSGPNTPAPSCDSTQDVANNVAVYTFVVPFGGFTDFTFGGFSDVDVERLFSPALTGLQPYLSIFSGIGDSAVFVTSSHTNPIVILADAADLRVFLAAGTYTLAISNLTNQSVAESTGGTLGQGFLGRGDPALVGSGSYQLTATVPEPDTLWLAAIGVAVVILRRRRVTPQ